MRDGKPGGEWPRLCEVLFEKKTGILRYLVLIFQNSYVNNYGLAELGDMQKTIKKLKLNKVQHESLHTCFKVRIASNMLSCLRTEINFNWPQSLPSGLHCPANGPDQVSSWPKLTLVSPIGRESASHSRESWGFVN